MIENIKARIFCKKYCIWEQKITNIRKFSCDDYWIYNDVLYYGHPLFIFFQSSQNSWYKANKQ